MGFLMHNGKLTISFSKNIGISAYLLGLYFVMVPFDIMRIGNMGSILRVVSALPLISVLLTFKSGKVRMYKISVLLASLLGLYWMSLFYSVSPRDTQGYIFTQTMNIGLILIVTSMHRYSRKEAEFLKKCLIAGSVLIVLLIVLFSRNTASGRITLGFQRGVYADQNYLNGYMMFLLAYFASEFFKHKKIRYAVGILLLLLISFATGSRGALVACVGAVIAAAFFTVKDDRKSRSWVFLLLLLSVIIFLVFYDVMLSVLPEKLAMRFRLSYILEHGTTGRGEIWEVLLGQLWDGTIFRQLFGFGPGSTSILNPIKSVVSGIGLVAHNLWIDQLFTLGILGMIVLVWLQLEIYREICRQRDGMLFAAFTGFLLMGCTMSLLSYKPVWNCIILVLIMQQCNDSEAVQGYDET